MELLGKPGLTKAELKRIEAFVDEWPMVEFDRSIMDAAIVIRREHRLKLPDAIIAATAIALDVPLLTADADFQRLKGDLRLMFYEV